MARVPRYPLPARPHRAQRLHRKERSPSDPKPGDKLVPVTVKVPAHTASSFAERVTHAAEEGVFDRLPDEDEPSADKLVDSDVSIPTADITADDIFDEGDDGEGEDA